jgi:hypothetical protein
MTGIINFYLFVKMNEKMAVKRTQAKNLIEINIIYWDFRYKNCYINKINSKEWGC